jgi:HAMP domain-containing protein
MINLHFCLLFKRTQPAQQACALAHLSRVLSTALGTGGVDGCRFFPASMGIYSRQMARCVRFGAKCAIKERLMSASPSSFSSVKLPAGLVTQAREAATPMRRSVAGQIEYWATLGRIAEASGLTISEAREAIALYDVRQTTTVSAADPLDAIEADFVAAESGRLAQAVRQTVQSNRRQVVKAA